MSRWAPSYKRCSEVSIGLALCYIFVSDVNSATEYTLNKRADDTKLSSAVNTLKGKDAAKRDLNRFQR